LGSVCCIIYATSYDKFWLQCGDRFHTTYINMYIVLEKMVDNSPTH